jgi:hypothetical protein
MSRKHLPYGRSQVAEHWTKMLRPTMETAAWRSLSTTAQALYVWLKFEWRGPDANNNGQIRLSVRQAANRLGVSVPTATKAFQELQGKGFIVQTQPGCLGVEGAAKSPAYELTEIKMPGAVGDGRKLYKEWSLNSDFHVQKSPANNPHGIGGKGGQKAKPRQNSLDGPIQESCTKQRRLS